MKLIPFVLMFILLISFFCYICIFIWRHKDQRKKILIAICCVVVIAISAIGVTYIPHKIITIKPSEVTSIFIQSGSTGKGVTISDKDSIQHIIENLNGITFSKNKLSFFMTGWSLRIKINKQDGSLYKELVIDGTSQVRYAGFFYKVSTNNIDYNYMMNLLKAADKVPMKGLELYVWKNKELTGNSDTYYTLLLGTNRNKESSEIYDLNTAVKSIEQLNIMLTEYSAETVMSIYQMNTTDFSKAEMQAISDNVKFLNGNGSKSIGLWEK